MADPWLLILTLGPLLLIGVIAYATFKNRRRRAESGEVALGTSNAVRGSEQARPDVESDAARAEAGEERP